MKESGNAVITFHNRSQWKIAPAWQVCSLNDGTVMRVHNSCRTEAYSRNRNAWVVGQDLIDHDSNAVQSQFCASLRVHQGSRRVKNLTSSVDQTACHFCPANIYAKKKPSAIVHRCLRFVTDLAMSPIVLRILSHVIIRERFIPNSLDDIAANDLWDQPAVSTSMNDYDLK